MSVLETSGILPAARTYMEGFQEGFDKQMMEFERSFDMSNAVKCEVCGKFEDDLGYSVRIYKRNLGTDVKGRPREYVKRVVTADHVCSECTEHVAHILNVQDLDAIVEEEMGD